MNASPLTYDLSGIWTVNHPSNLNEANNQCVITSYKFCSDANCTTDVAGGVFSISGTTLSVDISSPKTSETIYVTAVTGGDVTLAAQIQLKVCGNETIALTDAETIQITENPSNTATKVYSDVSSFFTTSDPTCLLTYSLVIGNDEEALVHNNISLSNL